MSAFGTSPNFNEPDTDDTTSAPPIQSPAPNPMSQILSQRKKKGFGQGVKNPGALAGAISRAKRARQTGQKYGN